MNERALARVRAWLAFVAMVAFIASTLSLAFDISSFLRARGFLWRTVQTLFAVSGIGFAYLLVFGAGLRTAIPYLRALPLLALYAYAMIEMRKSPAERFHFLEYGVLYLLALRATAIDARTPLAYAIAIVPAGLAGWFDEVLQGMTPNRHFDWGDVRMNVVAVSLAAAISLAFFGRRPELARFPYLSTTTDDSRAAPPFPNRAGDAA